MRSIGCRRSAGGVRILTALMIGSFVALTTRAQEKKPDGPRVTAISPITVSPGTTVTLKVRGAKLSTATEVRFPTAPSVKVTLGEKKSADVPAGLDAKDIGDTQLEAELILPCDVAPGLLGFVVITPDGTATGGSVRVRAAAQLLAEKEPDNGFREAQPIELGGLMVGSIKEDKDVDVFRFAGRARQRITADVIAPPSGSLLDPALTVFDASGQILATNDDVAPSRDARVEIELSADGAYFFCVTDAHDRGGVWHNYEFSVHEVGK